MDKYLIIATLIISPLFLLLECNITGENQSRVDYETVYQGGAFGLEPAIWADGIKQEYTLRGGNGIIEGIYVKDSRIFTSCYSSGNLCGVFISDSAQVNLGEKTIAQKLMVFGDTAYIAGTKTTPRFQASYWKIYINEKTSVGIYNKTAAAFILNDLGISSQAVDITISEGDIYVAGFTWKSGNNYSQACYWKNNSIKVLTDGTRESQALAIAVCSSGVYVAGYEYNVPILPGEIQMNVHTEACIWKNDQKFVIAQDGLSASRASGISVDKGDVYVVFTENDKPYVWKNGIINALPTSTGKAYARAITVVDGDVFVGGDETHKDYSTPIACYWKNGKQVLANSEGFGECIAVLPK